MYSYHQTSSQPSLSYLIKITINSNLISKYAYIILIQNIFMKNSIIAFGDFTIWSVNFSNSFSTIDVLIVIL